MAASSLLLMGANGLHAAERIVSYDVWLEPQIDRSLIVTEIVRIDPDATAHHDGVVRFIDLNSPMALASNIRILAATNNNVPVAVTLEEAYGQATVKISPAPEDNKTSELEMYTLRYLLTDQVSAASGEDRIVWSVKPDAWSMLIDRAKIRIATPEGVQPRSWFAALNGSPLRSREVSLEQLSNNQVAFTFDRPVVAGSSLTLNIGWPAGTVQPLSIPNLVLMWAKANPTQTGLTLAYAIIAIYMSLVAFGAGQGPLRGPLVPRPLPPRNFSPAALRAFVGAAFDHRSFTAVLLDMAAKGCLIIVESHKGIILRRNPGEECQSLTPEEQALDERLFANGTRLEVPITPENRTLFEAAQHDVAWMLKQYAGPRYWRRMFRYFCGAVMFATLSAGAVLMLSAPPGVTPYELALALACFGVVYTVGVRCAIDSLRMADIMGWSETLFSYRSVPIAGALIGLFGLGLWLKINVGFVEATGFTALFLFTAAFYYVLDGPTAEGQRLFDAAKCFRMYLVKPASADKYYTKAPKPTRALFEKWIGAAYALGVERPWSRAFRNILPGKGEYKPTWYQGTDFDPLRLEHELYTQLARAITSNTRQHSIKRQRA